MCNKSTTVINNQRNMITVTSHSLTLFGLLDNTHSFLTTKHKQN